MFGKLRGKFHPRQAVIDDKPQKLFALCFVRFRRSLGTEAVDMIMNMMGGGHCLKGKGMLAQAVNFVEICLASQVSLSKNQMAKRRPASPQPPELTVKEALFFHGASFTDRLDRQTFPAISIEPTNQEVNIIPAMLLEKLCRSDAWLVARAA